MYLELADCGPHMQESVTSPQDYYLYIPDQYGEGGVWLREDQLDDLPLDQYMMILDMQPQMSGLFGTKEQRLQRRADRQARKADRQAHRGRRREAATVRKETGQTFFTQAITGAKDIVGSITGRPSVSNLMPTPTEKGLQVQAGYTDPATGILQQPVVIIGGVLLIGGIAWAISRAGRK